MLPADWISAFQNVSVSAFALYGFFLTPARLTGVARFDGLPRSVGPSESVAMNVATIIFGLFCGTSQKRWSVAIFPAIRRDDKLSLNPPSDFKPFNRFLSCIAILPFFSGALQCLGSSGIGGIGGGTMPPPTVVVTQYVSVAEDSSVQIHLDTSLFSPDTIYMTIGLAAHGTWTGTLPDITYTPATNYFGADQIIFWGFTNITSTREEGLVEITVEPVNDPPHANLEFSDAHAFPGFTNPVVIAPQCDGDGWVLLSGYNSSDPDDDPLACELSEGTNVIADAYTGYCAASIGSHTYTLTVSDGTLTDTTDSTVEVITPSTAVAQIKAAVEAAGLRARDTRHLTAPLAIAIKRFELGLDDHAIKQLQLFQKRVQRRVVDPNLASDLMSWSQWVIHRTPLGFIPPEVVPP